MPANNANLDQVTREAFETGNPNARVDQVIREAFETGNPNARVDQVTREAFVLVGPEAHIDQVIREAWIPINNANDRVDQVVREAFLKGTSNVLLDQFIRESWIPLSAGETSSAAKYYLGLLTSQYRNSPKLISWLGAILAPVMDVLGYLQLAYLSFQIDNAVGTQLDVIGQWVGQSRTISFTPAAITAITVTPIGGGNTQVAVTVGASGKIFSGNDVILEGLTSVPALNGAELASVSVAGLVVTGNTPGSFGSFSGTETGTVTVNTPPLDDATYRIVLKAKIAKNTWKGQIGSLYAIWAQLFPGGVISIQDNQDMTANIFLTGSFNAIIQSLIVNDYIVPRPQAVLYNFDFGDFPLFGFDENNAFIAGFDVGNWS